ncbi:MAG: hypothetical protein ACREK6_00640 [Candidatus Rokuibacteriota bacterium]
MPTNIGTPEAKYATWPFRCIPDRRFRRIVITRSGDHDRRFRA